jgi:hypothetical protein
MEISNKNLAKHMKDHELLFPLGMFFVDPLENIYWSTGHEK